MGTVGAGRKMARVRGVTILGEEGAPRLNSGYFGQEMLSGRHRFRRLAAAALAAFVAAAAGRAALAQEVADDGGHRLSKLEQESVDEALGNLGLVVEPNPAGKIIGTIYVVNGDVFSPRDWYFQWFNIFHRTTRENILRRELLFRPGQPYDQALVEESMRNLQTPPTVVLATGKAISPPELSSVVAIVPVKSPEAGKVDVLAVTRDVWSLRFNTSFEFQQATLSMLDTSLSENNLFGWRKFLSVGFSLDLGKYGVGPTYFDPNILGTRMQLYANALAFYSRDTGHYEGNVETVSLVYPLYSLASRWGAGLAFSHDDEVIRSFFGTALVEKMLTDPPGGSVPYIFRRRREIVDANATRSFGASVIQRATLGYFFDDRHYVPVALSQYEGATPVQVAAFMAQWAPPNELRSQPYARYDLFTARYGVYRDLDTFDLRENAQLGPLLSLLAAYGSPELGATYRAVPLSASVRWTFEPLIGGLLRLSASGGLRMRDGRAIDQLYQARLYAATPMLRRFVRLVLSGEVDGTHNDTQHQFFVAGGDTGLRGYAIGEFQGPSMIIAHAELRTAPLAIVSQRFGAVLFGDAGDAASSFSALIMRADAGLGIRWLIPQLNASVIRFDWAVALVDGDLTNGGTRAGLPGRFSAGFQQIF
jgi:hypothetical protein